MKINKKILFFIILISTIFLMGCTLQEIQKTETSLEKINVRFKWVHATQFAGFYAAQINGYYADVGLDAELKENNPNLRVDPIEEVVNGEADFAVAEGSKIIQAVAEGKPIVAIGTVYKITPSIIFALKSKNITKPESLLGKTLKTSPTTHIPYLSMMKKRNLNASLVTEISKTSGLTKGANYLEDIKDGTFDASEGYVVNQPLYLKDQGYEVVLVKPSDYGVRSYSDVIITRTDTTIDNPELVKKFLEATIKGWKFSINNPEEAADITIENYKPATATDIYKKHEIDLLKESFKLLIAGDKNLLTMEDEIWQAMIDDLLDLGLLESPIESKSVYDSKFLDGIYG